MNDDTITPFTNRKRESRKPSALEDFACALEKRIHEVAAAAAASAAAKLAPEVERLKLRVAWLEANVARQTVEPLKDCDK
jgi:hypothetical protein